MMEVCPLFPPIPPVPAKTDRRPKDSHTRMLPSLAMTLDILWGRQVSGRGRDAAPRDVPTSEEDSSWGYETWAKWLGKGRNAAMRDAPTKS